MATSNADRQAAYRARRRLEALAAVPKAPSDDPIVAQRRIRDLEDEVKRLKRLLASRPLVASTPSHPFNSRPFSPAPKTPSR